MDNLPERQPSFIDDPDTSMAVVNAGILATFVFVQEAVPPKFQDMTRVLGAADVIFNLASWRVMHQRLRSQQ